LVISIKSRGKVIKRILTKPDSTATLNVNNVLIKKSKKTFNDFLQKYYRYYMEGDADILDIAIRKPPSSSKPDKNKKQSKPDENKHMK
jgi:hypothetical protein